jgi:hypothetical protein
VVKLNGNLVPLQAQAAAARSGSNGFTLAAPVATCLREALV